MGKESRYSPVPQSPKGMKNSSEEGSYDAEEGLLERDDAPNHPSRQDRRLHGSNMCRILHWIAHASTIVLLLGLYIRQEQPNRFAAETSLYSPVQDYLGDNSRIETFHGSFWQKSAYKGPPTKKIVEAWEDLTMTPALNLTAEEMARMGFSLDSVQYPQEMGGGYLAYTEASHQLHCLQALWEDHHYRKYPEMFPLLTEKLHELPVIMEHHLEHCVDVIRQQLMCTANPGMVTFRWVDGVSGPYPDFNTRHICHDYEALLEWGRLRAADQDKLGDYQWPVPVDAVKMAKAP